MVSLRYLPITRIVYVFMRTMRSAMAPPVKMERTLTSSGVNLTCGPVMATEAQRALVILVLHTDVQFL